MTEHTELARFPTTKKENRVCSDPVSLLIDTAWEAVRVPLPTNLAGLVFWLVFLHHLDVFFEGWGVIISLCVSFDASDFVL